MELNKKAAKSDVINEEFNNTENLPKWIDNLKVQGSIGKSLYFLLVFFR